jgi:5-formyltetrahydrofolate cyclo-ligase
MSSPSDRETLRRNLRARRRALSWDQRAEAARRFAVIARRTFLFRPRDHVAFYMPYGGEADPSHLLDLARQLRCAAYLPLITSYRHNRMSFAPFDPRERLARNRYGIPEPIGRRLHCVPTRMLDVIILPLIAVDPHGWRLGSGAGFYDRALHRLRAERHWRRPKLIGLAYEFQRIEHLDPHPWDVPVDAVLTESNLYFTRRNQRE